MLKFLEKIYSGFHLQCVLRLYVINIVNDLFYTLCFSFVQNMAGQLLYSNCEANAYWLLACNRGVFIHIAPHQQHH